MHEQGPVGGTLLWSEGSIGRGRGDLRVAHPSHDEIVRKCSRRGRGLNRGLGYACRQRNESS